MMGENGMYDNQKRKWVLKYNVSKERNGVIQKGGEQRVSDFNYKEKNGRGTCVA